MKTKSGFTIVELLIVIVVIAILAAISIVAYNGVQQRSSNTAIISAASQAVKSIKMYFAQEGAYPAVVSSGSIHACVTTQVTCAHVDSTVRPVDTTFNTNMAKIGSLPLSVPVSGSAGNGVAYTYDLSRQFNGQAKPAMIAYYLFGRDQACGLSDVMDVWGTGSNPAVTSTTGYTYTSTATNKTVCYISL